MTKGLGEVSHSMYKLPIVTSHSDTRWTNVECFWVVLIGTIGTRERRFNVFGSYVLESLFSLVKLTIFGTLLAFCFVSFTRLYVDPRLWTLVSWISSEREREYTSPHTSYHQFSSLRSGLSRPKFRIEIKRRHCIPFFGFWRHGVKWIVIPYYYHHGWSM